LTELSCNALIAAVDFYQGHVLTFEEFRDGLGHAFGAHLRPDVIKATFDLFDTEPRTWQLDFDEFCAWLDTGKRSLHKNGTALGSNATAAATSSSNGHSSTANGASHVSRKKCTKHHMYCLVMLVCCMTGSTVCALTASWVSNDLPFHYDALWPYSTASMHIASSAPESGVLKCSISLKCCVIQKAKHGAKQPEERRLSVEQLDREKLKDHLLKHKK
jgi:hypothetical protein